MYLNKEQEMIVECEKNCLVIAGAGTGKTFTIVNKIKKIIEGNNEKKGIIVCTFTRKATDELKYRLYSSIDIKIINKHNLLIGTIHSICYELLKKYFSQSYSDYEIMSENSQLHFIYSKLHNLSISMDEVNKNGWDIAENLSLIFNEITDNDYSDELFENLPDDFNRICKELYPLYLRLTRFHKLFDFAQLQKVLFTELISNNEIIDNIAKDYNYIFVDEYQDVNTLQDKIISILEKKITTTLVGDPNQSIYAFRGAKPELFLKRINDCIKDNFDIYYLSTNYRSSKEIVDLSNNFLQRCNLLKHSIISNKGTNNIKCTFLEFDSDEQEADFYSNYIYTLKKMNVISSYNEIAFLFRSVKNHAAILVNSLKRNQVPLCIIGSGDFFDTDVGSFVLFISYICSLKKIKKINDLVLHFDNFPLYSNYFINNCFSDSDIDKVLSIKKNSKSAIGFIYEVLNNWHFFQSLDDEKGYNIGILSSLAESYDNYAEYFDFFEFYNYLHYMATNSSIDSYVKFDDNNPGVKVLTIHQAKGLEFPITILPSQNERKSKTGIIDKFRNYLNQSSKSLSIEQRRVFYVGITRAKQSLIISFSRKLKNRYKVYSPTYECKRVIDLFETKIKQDGVIKYYKKNVLDIPARNAALSYNQIHSYTLCPRYYKYKHIWGLKTVRISGQIYGSNMHRVVEALVNEKQNKEISVNDITDIFNTYWIEIPTSESSQDLKEKALSQIQSFYSNVLVNIKNSAIFSVEERFDIFINESLITGRYDLILQNADGYEIIDFKTGKERDYSEQLSLYSLAFKIKYGITPNKLRVIYINSCLSIFVQPIDENAIISQIQTISNNINNDVFEPINTYFCTDCPYNKLCDYFI